MQKPYELNKHTHIETACMYQNIFLLAFTHLSFQCRVSLCILSAGKCAHSCTAYSYSNHLFSCDYMHSLIHSVVLTLHFWHSRVNQRIRLLPHSYQKQISRGHCAEKHIIHSSHIILQGTPVHTNIHTRIHKCINAHTEHGGGDCLDGHTAIGIHASASSFQSLSQLLFCHSSSLIKICIKQVEGSSTVFGLTCVVENLQVGICSEV